MKKLYLKHKTLNQLLYMLVLDLLQHQWQKKILNQINLGLILQLINGTSSVLQILVRYFNGTIILTSLISFSSIFPVVCCMNLNEEPLLLLAGKSIIFSLWFMVFLWISWSFRKSITIFYWIIHGHYYINMMSTIYLSIIYFAYAVNKWSTILKCYIFISIIWNCCSSIWKCYSSFNMFLCIIITT